MECLNDDKMIKFRPDTFAEVRRELKLDQPGRVAEALDILESWIKMQPHFVKRDFPREYLERSLVTCKGLVERAKDRLDKLCTFRTLMPEFFSITDPKIEFTPLLDVISIAHMPTLTPSNHRVYINKVLTEVNVDSTILFTLYKYLTMLSEYFMKVEYCNGFILILDYSDINIMSFVTKISPMELRQIITLMTEGYGLRIKSIHVVTASKMADALIKLLKQVFSPKLGSRIHTHKTIETVYEFIPKEILPIDYDGPEKSLKEFHTEWIDQISSKEFMDYFKEMNRAKTNESYRPANKFNENYIGMPGSFRALSVD